MKGTWARRLVKGLTRKQVAIPLVVLMLLVTIFLIIKEPDKIQNLHNYLKYGVSPYAFLLLMMVLPIGGIPLSVFLVLVGMKFGIAGGIFFTALLMAVHMLCTYYLVHSFLRDWIIKLMTALKLPIFSEKRTPNRWHLFLFMLVPGLPYAVKNNLLALSGIPFGPYLLINWTAQFGLSIPIVLTGNAVMEMDLLIIAIAISLLFIVFLLQRYVKQRHKDAWKKLPDGKETETDKIQE